MKKITFCIMAMCLSLTFIPVQSNAKAVASSAMVASKSAGSAQAEVLLSRLHAISAMDKTNLSVSEKKDLRIELRSIRQQLKDIGGGGVYISVGAVILIVVLLIILL